MVSLTLKEIEADVGAFLKQLEAGEVITVLRDTEPVAEVMPLLERHEGLRPFGLCESEFVVPGDFDEPLPDDVLRLFEGV